MLPDLRVVPDGPASQAPAPARLAVDLRLTRPMPLVARFAVRGFTVLLGASGAGKTTLLKALAGLLPAAGEPFAGLPAHRRPVGYLPQGAALFPHLTVWRNVAFALDGTGRARRAAALAWLDRLGLADLAERYPAQISGGQRQRVALLRALARHPALLLLDEPTASLDAATGEAIMAELIARTREFGVPALVASHDALLAAMADHVAVLHGGTVAQEGAPEAVFAQPVDSASAGLLGWRNLYSGEVRGDGTILGWDSGGVTLRLRARAPEGRVRWGVPAGAVQLAMGGAGGRENRVGGIVSGRAVLSDQAIARVRCGAAEIVLSLPLAAVAGLPPVGEAVTLAIPAEAIRVWPGARTETPGAAARG